MLDPNGAPTLYRAEQIKGWHSYTRTDEGGMFPARPMGWQGLDLSRRLKLAWDVFTGKYDALDWRIYR